MGAKAHDVDLSHSGRKIARKSGGSKGVGFTLGPKKCRNRQRFTEKFSFPLGHSRLVVVYGFLFQVTVTKGYELSSKVLSPSLLFAEQAG